MKSIGLASVFLLSIWGVSAHALTVLSDVDDTLKISHVSNAADAAARVLSKQAFVGMPEALRAIVPSASHFIYVSARPAILGSQTASFLKANAFPSGESIQRQNGDSNDPLQFKAKRIRQIFLDTANSNETFLLIGDDTQADPEAYAMIASEFSDRIVGIYIHQITGRMLPSTSTPYLISYDLADAWAVRGLISSEARTTVTDSILKEKQLKNVIANFQICPKSYDPLDQKIALLIRDWCSKRNDLALSDIEN